MSIVQQLIAMGYPSDSAHLAAGNNRNLDQALNFIENDGIGFEQEVAPVPTGSGELTDADRNVPTVAQSFKCNQCGKLLPNDQEMIAHGQETMHANFSASNEKYVSPEETQFQLAEIVRKLKEKNEKKVEEEVKEEVKEDEEVELKSSNAGQAMAGYREATRQRELCEAAKQLRLKKAEDEEAKKRIREQIRMDQEERKSRQPGYVAPPRPAPESVTPPPAKSYTVTTIQFRLMDGQIVKQEFNVNEPLIMLRGWVEANHAKGTPFTMMTAFPRKVFQEDDMGTPLSALNLVPTASITLLNRTV